MNDAHVHDLAEFYALGLLDIGERAAVDAHVATCNECLRSLGVAEETAASLAAILPAERPSPVLAARLRAAAAAPAASRKVSRVPARRFGAFAPLATAAALALALGGSLVQNASLQSELSNQDRALTRVVHGHFLHVTLAPAAGSALAAKVLYAHDGSWIYVLADRPPRGTHVFATVDGAELDLGALRAAGGVASLAVEVRKPSAVSLRDGTRTLASGALPYGD